MKRMYIWMGVVAAVILAAGAVLFWWPSGEAKARVTATQFVSTLKSVSLTADTQSVREAIDQYYGPYVTADLLTRWKESPETAPGRDVSSPWPDRIFIKQVSPQGDGYVINADVLYMTSVEEATPEEDAAGVTVVMMLVIPTDDGWRIAAYEELFSEGLDATSTPEITDLRG